MLFRFPWKLLKIHRKSLLTYVVLIGILVTLFSKYDTFMIVNRSRALQRNVTHAAVFLPANTSAWATTTTTTVTSQLIDSKTETHDSTIQLRRENMMNQCATERMSTTTDYLKNYVYSAKFNFLFCRVAKVGSTFWLRLIKQVVQNVVASPYRIKPQLNMNLKFGHEEIRRLNTILNYSTKFLFVRNPYYRVYSAYIDKIYSPNPYYWKLIGTYIVKKFRKAAGRSHCGHDVTFHEFFQYVIHSESTGIHQDPHVLSVFKTCNPCKTKFDIVGKMETFKEDTFFILDDLHMEHYKEKLINITEDATDDAMYDIAQAFTVMRKKASMCIPKEEIVERIWRKLHIRGLVSMDIPAPRALLGNLDDMAVFKIFKDAHSNSSREILKQQKQSFLLEAFRTIPLKTLYDFSEVFRRDFKLFGYDLYPTEIFERSNLTNEHYNYFNE